MTQEENFEILSITDPNTKPGLEALNLPDNLQGKHVLELFSGDRENSLKQEIENRGGNYVSTDTNYVTDESFSFAVDATKELPFLPNSFDYILMSSPPVWKNAAEIDVDLVQTILTSALPVLKTEPGSFIGALFHLDSKNRDSLMEAISQNEAFTNLTPFFIDTGVPATNNFGKPVGGNEYALRLTRD